jgi:hypothetical protein
MTEVPCSLAFGFSAGGLLFPYYIGIISGLDDLSITSPGKTNIAGASAGSLIAGCYHAGIPVSGIMEATMELITMVCTAIDSCIMLLCSPRLQYLRILWLVVVSMHILLHVISEEIVVKCTACTCQAVEILHRGGRVRRQLHLQAKHSSIHHRFRLQVASAQLASAVCMHSCVTG